MPVVSPALETSAIDGSLEIQVQLAVMSSVVPSENVPVATSGALPETATFVGSGVIVIDASVADETVMSSVPETPPNEAVMVAVPPVEVVIRPLLPAASLTAAIDAADEVHV